MLGVEAMCLHQNRLLQTQAVERRRALIIRPAETQNLTSLTLKVLFSKPVTIMLTKLSIKRYGVFRNMQGKAKAMVTSTCKAGTPRCTRRPNKTMNLVAACSRLAKNSFDSMRRNVDESK